MMQMTIGRWMLALALSLLVHLTAVTAWPGNALDLADERSAGALAQLSVALTPSQFYPSVAAEETGAETVEEADPASEPVTKAEPSRLTAPAQPAALKPLNPPIAAAEPAEAQPIQTPSTKSARTPSSSSDAASVGARPITAPVAAPLATVRKLGSSLGVTGAVTKPQKAETSSSAAAANASALTPVREFKQAAIASTTPVETVVETPIVQPRQRPKRSATPKKRASKKKARKAKKKKGKTSRKSRQASVASSARKGTARRKVGEGGRSSKAAGRAKLSSYLGRVLSKVRRQKRYPAAAERKRKGGTAIIAFTITKRGAVKGIRLKRRSGNAALDREVMNMVRRAAPFPPIPKSTGRSRVAVYFPIQFKAY